MIKLQINDVNEYVKNNIGEFHKKKLEKLKGLRLYDVLRRKNPYLFKAKNIMTASEIVKALADAFVSSSEETMFGDWLEGLAIFINQKVYNGWKSGITGIDMEFDHHNTRYIVTIKSGPQWGNSSQIAKMMSDFTTAKKTLRTSNSNLHIVCVNGCCYGKDHKPDKGDYFKYCGQQFWKFIGGTESLYTDIIEPLGYEAKEHNNAFLDQYGAKLNLFTKEFTSDFCDENGYINWNRLVQFNSGDGED
ncbi:MAG: hypothetical protein LBT00_11390 [Spirochaetaceae bacterium]|nr:hypothetical protein [Spirochaetaceae bacterium]